MRRRKERGFLIILGMIAVCLFLIFIMRDSFFMQKTSEYKPGESEWNDVKSQEGGILPSDVPDNDIAVADSLAVPTEENDEQSMVHLTFLVNNLSFERSGSQILIGVVAGLLILYLVLIGPVTYFYLKKIRKMERMWIILPAVAVLFGCIILLMSNDFIIREPYADVIKVISPGRRTVCYGASTSPGEESYSLYFDDMVTSLKPWMTAENYSINEERRSLTLRPDYAFEKDYFQFFMSEIHLNDFIHNIQMRDQIGFGTIHNTTGYTFSHLMLCYKDNYCILSGMNPGDQFEIEADMWQKDEYGMVGSLKEELQMQTGLTIDEREIFHFAWYEHRNSAPGEFHIAAISKEGDAGLKAFGVDLISYTLFFK